MSLKTAQRILRNPHMNSVSRIPDPSAKHRRLPRCQSSPCTGGRLPNILGKLGTVEVSITTSITIGLFSNQDQFRSLRGIWYCSSIRNVGTYCWQLSMPQQYRSVGVKPWLYVDSMEKAAETNCGIQLCN